MSLQASGPSFTVLVLAGVIASGCASAPTDEQPADGQIPSEPTTETLSALYAGLHELASIEALEVTTEDGVALRGHVYLPDAEGPLATVLEYSPYMDSIGSPTDGYAVEEDGRTTMRGRHAAFLEAGFAVALVNLRGTGTSQGCMQWGSPVDVADVTAVIDSLAGMPWSNGAIGMTGLSYPGWTQYLAIAGGSPHLKAVIPTSGIVDPYSLVTRNGAAFFYGPILPAERTATTSYETMVYPPTDERWEGITHAPCAERFAEDNQWFADLAADGDRTDYWQVRDLRDELAASHVPIFYTNGLTNGEGHILQFEEQWDRIPTAEKRMLIGYWPHGFPQEELADFDLMSVAWFDHYLRGGPKLVPTGVVEYQDEQERWHRTDRWPPAGNETTLFLTGDRLVASADDVVDSSQTFLSRHTNPCPGLCTQDYATNLVATMEHQESCGPFQALYVSQPLKSDVLLAGNYHVNLTVTSTLPDGNFAAYLYHTPGPGTCPDTKVVEVRRALADLRHPAPEHPGAPFPVNTPSPMDIRSHPFATNVPAGHRLVLAIGGGSLDLFPEARQPVLTVSTGTDISASITLTAVDGTLEFA